MVLKALSHQQSGVNSRAPVSYPELSLSAFLQSPSRLPASGRRESQKDTPGRRHWFLGLFSVYLPFSQTFWSQASVLFLCVYLPLPLFKLKQVHGLKDSARLKEIKCWIKSTNFNVMFTEQTVVGPGDEEKLKLGRDRRTQAGPTLGYRGNKKT